LYLADLDAIEGGEPCLGTYAALRDEGFRLWVDAGVRTEERAGLLAGAGVTGIVAGLETVAGPAALAEVVAEFGERVIFSLDLRGGVALGDRSAWKNPDAWLIAGQAVDLGVRRLLVLDLARVGEATGTGTEELCARLAAAYPDVEVSAGGGVRGVEDLRRLKGCGVRAALVASALHDGRLGRADLDAL
jgi:phosphoribosylformimino-5-aminoimidazole carboxamide ribotide isomerase